MKEPVYFLGLELENVRCFGEKAKLDLSDGKGNWQRWTVILGDNGTGKTTLLQSISLFETEERLSPPDFKIMRAGPKMKKIAAFFIEKDFLNYKDNNQIANNKVVLLTLTDIVFVSPEDKTNKLEIQLFKNGGIATPSFDLEDKVELDIYGYGASRFMNLKAESESENENCITLFNDTAKLVNAEEWLLNMDYAASRESHLKSFAEKRKKLIIEVLLDLLPDIRDINFTTPTKEKLTPSLEFETEYGYWVSIHNLSLGYKTMVAWMVDLAARMFKRYPESNNPLKEPAIVLVDEIDLHLHPKWQRKIFDYLSDKFPKTQFIVTAHSPLIVQSAPKDANIVVLRKSEDGSHVIIDNDVKSVQNWRLDQILSSDLFGGLPVRNDDVEEMLKRRNELIEKTSLSAAEKEELAELNNEANKLPFAEKEVDIEAKEIIRKAAEYFKHQGVH